MRRKAKKRRQKNWAMRSKPSGQFCKNCGHRILNDKNGCSHYSVYGHKRSVECKKRQASWHETCGCRKPELRNGPKQQKEQYKPRQSEAVWEARYKENERISRAIKSEGKISEDNNAQDYNFPKHVLGIPSANTIGICRNCYHQIKVWGDRSKGNRWWHCNYGVTSISCRYELVSNKMVEECNCSKPEP